MTEIQFDENTVTEVTISHTVESDGVEIQLETPLELHGVSMTSSETSNVKPKRLSDEFSSLDEETDEIDDDDDEAAPTNVKGEVACCSKASSITENDDMDESSSSPPFISDKAETSSCISLCFSSSSNMFVQSLDEAMERADFESEQKLTGGIIIRASSLTGANNRLNFDVLSRRSGEHDEIIPTTSGSQESSGASKEGDGGRNKLTTTPTSSRCSATSAHGNKSTIRSKQKLSEKIGLVKNVTLTVTVTDDFGGKRSESPREKVQAAEHSKSVKVNLFDDEPSTSSGGRRVEAVGNFEEMARELADDSAEHRHHLSDDIIDEDTWADCEEGSDSEEVCTCQNDSDDEYGASSSSSEDELPSRDVDLSSYTQLDSISDDILQESGDGTPKIPRKRKLTEQSMIHAPTESPITLGGNRKRLALDSVSTPHSSHVLSSPLSNLATPKSSSVTDKRTPRLIPTKENPPPELMDWLLQFQRWTNAERIHAVDKLIEHCEPTQVRHMMKIIEPLFQRDFISLLPKELALHVLSYLDPEDLLRAAQTCRSWRFLADDNLLWKEKCKQSGIVTKSKSLTDKPKRGRTGSMPKIASAWKAAYMRHHTIETNWRSNQIRTPKILSGHDDHVITCLQFCGNRIVSGSDDNTLKVWSAVSGKCLRTLIGHTGGVWSSQMSVEGNIIISGSTDRTLKVWDAESGLCKYTLFGHTSTVRCMHLHGTRVVSGSRDATLRVWDITDGTCLHILVGHLAAVRCVQYDGKLVVSGAYDFQVDLHYSFEKTIM